MAASAIVVGLIIGTIVVLAIFAIANRVEDDDD